MCALSAEQIAGLSFEQVVNAAAVSIVVVDASGTVIHSNEQARALTAKLGVEMPADLDRAIEADLDRPIDIFHPDGRRYEHHEWPAVRSLTSGEEIVEEEFFYAVPGGERLWIRCSSSLVRDQSGQIVAVVLVQTDVTERKREETRLAYLAGLLDSTEDAIVALDAEWFVTVWNPGAERMYGWTADEVLGRHTLEVARPEMSYEERVEARRAVAEHGRWRGEVVAHRKDGTSLCVELITVALRGERREITGYLGIHRDITERRRMTDELRESQQHTETILESITDASVAIDRDWRYVHANDRALARLAAWRGMPVTREDIIGKSVWDLFPDARGTETESRLRAAMDATEPVEFEMYFGPTDEWVEAHAHPSASGLTIYYRNITARRRAEEALREAQQLRRQAERRLNEVRVAERGRVARELHDLTLQGLARALTATGSEGTNRDDDVDAILRRAGEELRAAIYDLSLEESGERTLGDSLGDLVDMTRELAPECEVTLDIDDDLAARSVGRRQAEVLRILGQALTDARRHAEAEHIVVRVTSTETRLSVEVTDDGRGAAAGLAAAPGEGVRGMYERARLLGAELDIRTDDTGTTVRLQIALSPAAAVPGAAAGEHPSQSIDTELLLAARHGPGPARERLVDAFLPRIEQIARAVSTTPTPPSQLTEQGAAGLLRALDRYDSTLDTPFWGYARWWVREAMR